MKNYEILLESGYPMSDWFDIEDVLTITKEDLDKMPESVKKATCAELHEMIKAKELLENT